MKLRCLSLLVLCGAMLAPAAFADVSTSAGASNPDGVMAPAIVLDQVVLAEVLPTIEPASISLGYVGTSCHSRAPTVPVDVKALYAAHLHALTHIQAIGTVEGVPKRHDI